MSKRKPQHSVFIRHLEDDRIKVLDAETQGNPEFGTFTKDELLTKANKENWHLIPLAVTEAVMEFAAGGWKATRPAHTH